MKPDEIPPDQLPADELIVLICRVGAHYGFDATEYRSAFAAAVRSPEPALRAYRDVARQLFGHRPQPQGASTMKTKQPTQKQYESTAAQRMKTKALPLGKEPKPPALAKPLKKGGK